RRLGRRAQGRRRDHGGERLAGRKSHAAAGDHRRAQAGRQGDAHRAPERLHADAARDARFEVVAEGGYDPTTALATASTRMLLVPAVAVTPATRVCPASSAVSVYEGAVAPGIAAQTRPLALQRSHV